MMPPLLLSGMPRKKRLGDLSLKDASTVSAIYAALHVQGVQRVELMKPLADMVLDKTQASFCTDFKAEIGGSDE